MSTIVKYRNQSGYEYAYEQTSYYDPVSRTSHPKRKYLGKVDPETGAIIPTSGRKGRRPRKSDEIIPDQGDETDYKSLYEKTYEALKDTESQLEIVQNQVRELTKQRNTYERLLSSLRLQIDNAMNNRKQNQSPDE